MGLCCSFSQIKLKFSRFWPKSAILQLTIVFLVSKLFDFCTFNWLINELVELALSMVDLSSPEDCAHFKLIFLQIFRGFFTYHWCLHFINLFCWFLSIFMDIPQETTSRTRIPSQKHANYHEMTVECPRNSFENQQNWLTVIMYSEICWLTPYLGKNWKSKGIPLFGTLIWFHYWLDHFI